MNQHLFPFLALTFLFFHSCKNEPSTATATLEAANWQRTTNEVILRLPNEPRTLMPALVRTGYEKEVLELIHLYGMDFTFEEESVLAPELLKQAPIITEITEGEHAGRIRMDFEILAEATWDNGTPVTGNDYLSTIKMVFLPKLPAQGVRGFLDFLVGAEVDATNAKKFSLIANKYLLAGPAASNMTIIPAYVYDPGKVLDKYAVSDLLASANSQALENDPALSALADTLASPSYGRAPEYVIGAGPYRLVEWTAGQRIVLEKKQNWWGEALSSKYTNLQAYPDRIIYQIVADQTTALTTLKDEGLDVMSSIVPADFKDLQNNLELQKDFNLNLKDQYRYNYIGLNTKNPKLTDKQTRQAIAHLINMEELVEVLYEGFGTLTVGPVEPWRDYYNKNLQLREQNFDKARELLSAAGWADSNANGTVDKMIDGELTELEIDYVTTVGNTFGENLANYLAANSQKVGITINLVQADARTAGGRIRGGDFGLFGAASGWYPLPHDLEARFHSRSVGGGNYMGFSNPRADELMDKIKVTLDPALRKPMYEELQAILYDEVPMIFTYFVKERFAIHKRFETTISPRSPGYSPAMMKLREFTVPSAN